MQVHIRPGSNHDRLQLIHLQALAIETFYKTEYSPTQIDALRKKQADATTGYLNPSSSQKSKAKP
jgi:hypothetical protein